MPVLPDPFGSLLDGQLAASNEFRQNQQLQSNLMSQALDRAVTAATAPLQIQTLQERLAAARQERRLNDQFGAQERQAELNSSNALTGQRQSATKLNDFNLGTAQQTQQSTVDTAKSEAERTKSLAEAARINAKNRQAEIDAGINLSNATATDRRRAPAPSESALAAERDNAKLAAIMGAIQPTPPPTARQAAPVSTPPQTSSEAFRPTPVPLSPYRDARAKRNVEDIVLRFRRGGLSADLFASSIRGNASIGDITQEEAERLISFETGGR